MLHLHNTPCHPHPHDRRSCRARGGFTLLEVLSVLGIVCLLSGLLLPALSNARRRGYQTTCAATLKQFGLAFTMYAGDFDGRFPNPGGRGMQANATQPAVERADNGAVWCANGRTGQGLFAYLQRQTDESANSWSCPNALPITSTIEEQQEDNTYNIGQSYAMNDYLRENHPGEGVTAQGDVPGLYNPSFYTGIKLDEIGAGAQGKQATGPSQVILLFEGVEHPHGGTKRHGSPYFGIIPSRYGSNDLPMAVPEEYHFGMSNFLFCDGHVKALHPTQTWTPATQDQVEKLNYHYAHARGGRFGTGTIDLWNPQSQVTYP